MPELDQETFLERLLALIHAEVDEAAEEGINLAYWQVAKLINEMLLSLYPEIKE